MAALRTEGIVTPEAVVLEFETAGLASRLLSGFVDVVIQGLILGLVLLAALGLSEVGLNIGGLGTASFFVLFFLMMFGYPVVFETLWRGRTPGKALLGLRVVTIEGGPIRFRHAAIRAIVGVLDKNLSSGLVGVVAVLVTRRNQRMGDVVGGTIVLRERSGAKAPSAVHFSAPRGLEAFVAGLDASRIGHQDYGTVRSFLVRSSTLSPAARSHLAAQLAGPLAARLSTSPPAGLPPEVFLMCVAAAHQQRNAPVVPVGGGFESVWSQPIDVSRPAPAAPVKSDTGFTAPG